MSYVQIGVYDAEQGDTGLEPVSVAHPFPVRIADRDDRDQKLITIRQLVQRDTGGTAYTANDAVGTMLAFPNVCRAGRGGVIETISIIDLTGQKAALILTLFNQTFTATADNAAYAVADGDYVNAVATIPVAATDYSDSSAAAIGTVKPALAFALQGTNTSLYGQLETTGTPTYAANNQDLYIVMTVRQF